MCCRRTSTSDRRDVSFTEISAHRSQVRRRRERPQPDALLLAADVELVDELEPALVVSHERAGRVRDEHGMPELLRQLLQSRRRVDGISDRGVLEPPRRADVAGHEGAAANADSDPEVRCALELRSSPRVESWQPLVEHLPRRDQRTVGVVVRCDRGAEHGEDAVAEEAEQCAAVVEDRVAHLAQVAVEHVDDDVRRGLLGEGRESAQVAEEDGADQADAAEARFAVRVAHHLVDDGLGQEPGEHVTHAVPLDLREPPLHEPGVDPCPEQRGVERLRQVVLGPGLDAAHDAFHLVDGRDHDHRDAPRGGDRP